MPNLFAHRSIRFKLLVALIPLVLMLCLVTLFTLVTVSRIDAQYRTLLEQGHTAFLSLARANQRLQRLGTLLYQEIAETDSDRMQRIDAEIEGTYSEYKVLIATGIKAAPPQRARGIATTEALLDSAFIDSRVVRTKALINAKDDAMRAMRGGLDAELRNAQQMLAALVDAIHDDVMKAGDATQEQSRRDLLLLSLFAAIGLLLGGGVSGLLLRRDVARVLTLLRDAAIGAARDVPGREDEVEAVAAESELAAPVVFPPRRNDEAGEIYRALRALHQVACAHAVRGWIHTEQTALSAALQGTRNPGDLAAALLSRISQSIPLLYGSLYLADDTCTRFSRAGGFALSANTHAQVSTAATAEVYGLGEGLVGQAALERRQLTLTPPDDAPLTTASGFGGIVLPQIVLVPVVWQNQAIAVLELAPAAPLSSRQQALLEALQPLLAFHIQIFAGAQRLRALYEREREQIVAREMAEQQALRQRKEVSELTTALAGQNRRQDELAATLELERTLLRVLIDQLPELVFVKDAQGIYRMANQAFANFLGRPAAGIIGRGDRDLVGCPAAHIFRDSGVTTVATMSTRVVEETVLCADGRSIVLETTSVPLTRADGSLYGVVGISRNVGPPAAFSALAPIPSSASVSVSVQSG